jgi:uncharacterized membrane protein
MISKGRIEAFSDGVVAILITILVLDLKVPHEADLRALTPLLPVFLTYVLSFIYLGIYWNNHHHMFHVTTRVSGWVMWSNLHLLFWLSLVPFTTAWMGENHFGPVPTALYGAVLLMAAIAYWILQASIIRAEGPHSKLATAIGRDWKGRFSPLFYISGIGLAFVYPWLSQAIYVIVAAIWFVPDRRLEKTI